VLDIQHCYLQKAPSNEIRLKLRDFAQKQGFSFFDIPGNAGLLRSLIIRTSITDDVMVTVMFGKEDQAAIQAVMAFLQAEFPAITSLHYVINPKANDTFYDLQVKHFAGLPYIREKIASLELRLGPKSFYQTNSEGAQQLFDHIKKIAAIQPHETVYDLYTGIGSIALYLAHQAKQVIGIETVPEAIEWAEENAARNGIGNVRFFTGEMRKVLDQAFIEAHGRPDVLIADPPRDGMHPKVVKAILEIAPQRIIYVSCNPSTQARDLTELKNQYQVEAAQPVDMFPHTFHVENILLLTRINGQDYG